MRPSFRVPFESQLPATPCHEAMRDEVEQLAKVNGMSMAEVQRQAIRFFLNWYASGAIENTSLADNIVEDR